jgi:hypothetical protein
MVKSKKQHNKHQSITDHVHTYVGKLNNSKIFAGVVMILLNVGSKLIPIQIGGSAEEYVKKSLNKYLLVFAMAWMGTRDIYTSLLLTVGFIIMSEYIFNDDSPWCIIPSYYKHTTNESIKNRINDKVRPEDISNVIKSLEDLKLKL